MSMLDKIGQEGALKSIFSLDKKYMENLEDSAICIKVSNSGSDRRRLEIIFS